MKKPTKILLQTTISFTENDWHIGRFSLLQKHLESLKDETGNQLYEVTARNRELDENGNDKILSNLDKSDFDELWLFAVDTGNGLMPTDCAAITRFRQRGGGIFSTRDHPPGVGDKDCVEDGVTVPPAPGESDCDWEYLPRLYFIRNNKLCRADISANQLGAVPLLPEDGCLADDVQDLHIQFGIDTDGD
ncbi:hypothetical protein L0337_45870, partial [candidate division KSB1 bacterium]|nr:hypothetical protein [candidate division KSB1 bacterium]